MLPTFHFVRGEIDVKMDRLRYYLKIVDWKFLGAIFALGGAVVLIMLFA